MVIKHWCNVLDAMVNMQITNSVVCETSKGRLYIQIKQPYLGEHAFPLMRFVCESNHVTFGVRSGIRSTARPELPYPCNSKAKSQDETSQSGK